MAAVRQAAAIQGWQAEQIHEEAFQASMPANDVRQEETFTVTLASSWPVLACRRQSNHRAGIAGKMVWQCRSPVRWGDLRPV